MIIEVVIQKLLSIGIGGEVWVGKLSLDLLKCVFDQILYLLAPRSKDNSIKEWTLSKRNKLENAKITTQQQRRCHHKIITKFFFTAWMKFSCLLRINFNNIDFFKSKSVLFFLLEINLEFLTWLFSEKLIYTSLPRSSCYFACLSVKFSPDTKTSTYCMQ